MLGEEEASESDFEYLTGGPHIFIFKKVKKKKQSPSQSYLLNKNETIPNFRTPRRQKE